ncbi:MAG: lactate utilization protein [Deltaproteobacteria bacterium]|nr:lactate utilization protein [Deltaproteobacteria bacterium]
MDEFVKAHYKLQVDEAVKALQEHGFDARFFETRDEAVSFIMAQAAECKTVGVGGTKTVRALGIVDLLDAAGKTVYDNWKLKPGTPEELQCRKAQMTTDLFLSSANAVTVTGEIVNKEASGNRTNSMTFGPQHVIIVVGRNKIVPDIAAALDRIERVAAPVRAMGMGRKTPCVKTGVCMDCDSPDRICRITTILHRNPLFTKISVVILDEDLGY